jgi:BspA type Leucine rich repeat region (6 copies)
MKTSVGRSLIQTCLLAAVLLALPAAVQAQFYYTTNNGTITITGYTGSGGAVTIPDTLNGLPVTDIGDWAFEGSQSLTSVLIPDSVTSIGDLAFYACSSLTNVIIGNGVTSILDSAFYSCYSLTAINVDAANLSYSSVNGVLFDKNQTTLIEYPGGLGGSYTVPDSVTSIGEYAFYGTALTSATIPNSVTSIGDGAFKSSGLTRVTIGNGVSSIGDDAFAFCNNLTNVAIGNGVTNIGDNAFYDCEGLTSTIIPDGVTSIGNDAFAGSGLSSVTIPDSVTTIAAGAFSGCSAPITVTVGNLNYSSTNGVLFDKNKSTIIQAPTSLVGNYTIPNSVTNIGDAAFYKCESLTDVTIGNSVTNIGNDAFGYCYYLASVTIPNSVTNIGSGAFYECFSLKNVTIPNSVIGVGSNAFYQCSSLRRIYFTGNAPVADSSLFSLDYTTAYYLTNASGWSSTFAGIPTALWNPAPPPTLRISQSSPGMMTLSWQGSMVLIYSGSLDFNYPWFRAGDTSPVTAPIPLLTRFGNVTGPVGLGSQFFRLMDISDLWADFYANLYLARNSYAPSSIRVQACKVCTAAYFLTAPFGDLRSNGYVQEAVSIGFDLDPADPIVRNDIGLLVEINYQTYGP